MACADFASGDGTLYTSDGRVEEQWNDYSARGMSPLTLMHPIELQLDQYLGVHIAPGTGPAGLGRPQVCYMACPFIKYQLHAITMYPTTKWCFLSMC